VGGNKFTVLLPLEWHPGDKYLVRSNNRLNGINPYVDAKYKPDYSATIPPKIKTTVKLPYPARGNLEISDNGCTRIGGCAQETRLKG
jgi:hypothetical protein